MEDEEKVVVEKATKRKELVSNMNGKERYQYYKREAQGRKQQLKLLTILKADVNKKLTHPTEELTELKEVELLQQLRDVSNQIVAIRLNKNNSYYFRYNPNLGLNRKERRNG
jgi:hypothetical protein